MDFASLADLPASPNFVRSLAKGIFVIKVLGGEKRPLTITELATKAGLTRAGARRLLMTLEQLGYAKLNGRHYALTPRVMELGSAFRTANPLWDVVEPHLNRLVSETGETASGGVLDDLEVVYVLRVKPPRALHLDLGPGRRLPAHLSSMGRVLLGHVHPRRLDHYFRRAVLERYTDLTVTDEKQIRALIAQAAAQGFAIVVGEVEESIIGVSVPVRDAQGSVVGALNVSSSRVRKAESDVRSTVLPLLIEAARSIERAVGAPASP